MQVLNAGLSTSAVERLELIWGGRLSHREMEVARLALQGLSNQEIAATLFISENTVKTHLRNLFRKTRTRNRAELYRKLVEARLAVPGSAPEVPADDRGAESGLDGFLEWVGDFEAAGSGAHEATVVLMRLQFLNGGMPTPQPPSTLLELLVTAIRRRDRLFHWRDDLFLLALPGSDISGATEVADRLVRKVRRWSALKGLTVLAWIGAASLREADGKPEQVLQAAEMRLRPLPEVLHPEEDRV